MSDALRIACLQVNPTADVEQNVSEVLRMATEAVGQGAKFLLTPEHVALLDGRGKVMRDGARTQEGQPALLALRKFAAETGAWVLVGSVGILQDDGRISNRSYLIDGSGGIAATYDKIHMFDVVLPDGREMRESRRYRPGAEARLAATPWGDMGLTICYDLRFPQLFRALAKAGARIIAVPSAFTRPTGRDHWHTLLRARAIETGAFVIAPATCGEHPGGHDTYGHSLVVDPWGRVLGEAGDGPEVLIADLDLSAVASVRARLPSLEHDRLFSDPISKHSVATSAASTSIA